jgi:hypothetical protein
MVSLPGRSLGEGWHDLAEHVAELLDVGPGTRVFEVDCGSGEFLEPFYLNRYVVGGTDADASMIELAIAAMPDGLFTVAAASQLDPAVPWDVVICRSLGGAPDVDHLRGLVSRMCAKATHGIALLNVPEEQHPLLLRSLAETGARAVQIEGLNVFARV